MIKGGIRWAAAAGGLSLLDAGVSTAAAGGFALEQQNAAALGAAFSGAQARAGDPGYAAYNPAAIGGVSGVDVSVNATGVFTTTSYEGATGRLLGVAPISGAASGEGFGPPALVPNLAVAAPIGERFAVGLVVHAPFGLKTEFEPDSVLRYQAQESEAISLAASPTLAFEVSDALTLGASLRVQYVDLTVTAMIDAAGVAAASSVPGFAPGTSDLPASFQGDDIAIGVSAGFQAALSERLRIGGAYTSKIEHVIDGKAAFALADSAAGQVLNAVAGLFQPTTFLADFNTPASAGLGLEYAASDRLTLLASTTYTWWSAFEEVALDFANPAQPPEILRQDWEDGWSLSVGGEYGVAEETTLRAGFMYDATPVNDEFASPRIPDADRYWATIGVSQSLTDHLSGDLGFAVAFFENRPIALAGAAPESFFRGSLAADLETTAYALSGRLRWSF